MLKKLISLFKRGDRSLNNIESHILDAVAFKLPKDLANTLNDRLHSINLVQRINEGQEVNCYEIYQGSPILRIEHRLTDITGEVMLASFKVIKNDDCLMSGKVWLVDGVFFSLEYDTLPIKLIDNDEFKIEVNLLACSLNFIY